MMVLKAQKKHIPFIAAIEKACFTDPWSEKAVESSLCSAADIVLAAEENSFVCGYIIGSCDGYEGYIERIAVSSHMRKKGVGKALINAFAAMLPEAADEIALEVRCSNPAAEFYKKLGFEEIGIRKKLYSFPCEDGIVMKKVLLKGKKQ